MSNRERFAVATEQQVKGTVDKLTLTNESNPARFLQQVVMLTQEVNPSISKLLTHGTPPPFVSASKDCYYRDDSVPVKSEKSSAQKSGEEDEDDSENEYWDSHDGGCPDDLLAGLQLGSSKRLARRSSLSVRNGLLDPAGAGVEKGYTPTVEHDPLNPRKKVKVQPAYVVEVRINETSLNDCLIRWCMVISRYALGPDLLQPLEQLISFTDARSAGRLDLVIHYACEYRGERDGGRLGLEAGIGCTNKLNALLQQKRGEMNVTKYIQVYTDVTTELMLNNMDLQPFQHQLAVAFLGNVGPKYNAHYSRALRDGQVKASTTLPEAVALVKRWDHELMTEAALGLSTTVIESTINAADAPPPPKKNSKNNHARDTPETKSICRSYEDTVSCRYGKDCRFEHKLPTKCRVCRKAAHPEGVVGCKNLTADGKADLLAQYKTKNN